MEFKKSLNEMNTTVEMTEDKINEFQNRTINLPSMNNREKIKWENKTECRDLWEYHERSISLGSQKKKEKIKLIFFQIKNGLKLV